MTIEDLKLYVLNAGTVGLTTFTQIEDGLKVILLLVTIGYTVAKWKDVKKEKKK